MTNEQKTKENEMEPAADPGALVVITGRSGVGKDAVIDKLFENEEFISLGYKKVVTCCANRDIRPGEVDGVTYHFVTLEKLKDMESSGDLVENITPTGNSFKATPLSEVQKVIRGTHLGWRIDPSRAAEIVVKKFWSKKFPNHVDVMSENTLVIFIDGTDEEVVERRMRRDKEKYDPDNYAKRDIEEAPHLPTLRQYATVVNNPEGQLNETVSKVLAIVKKHHAKIKNK